jgi:hypothetical protein
MAKVKRDENGARIGRLASAYRADNPFVPKFLRIYRDPSGETDCITVVFTRTNDRLCHYVGLGDNGTVSARGEHDRPIDRPSYRHLGKKISFFDLGAGARRAVQREYAYFWGETERG